MNERSCRQPTIARNNCRTMPGGQIFFAQWRNNCWLSAKRVYACVPTTSSVLKNNFVCSCRQISSPVNSFIRRCISHTRTVVRECFKGDEASEWKRPKFRPIAKPKPLNRSSQKLACVIPSRTAPGVQNFVAIGLRVSAPKIRNFGKASGVTSFCSFFGCINKATAYTPEQIFTKNTSNVVVPGKEVPFGGLDDYNFYLDL